MKTSKFESTIRRKLESIEPEFQESDWMKMQDFMHTHTPPTFWKQYSSWIGYAAAASITTVMAFLYVTQLSKNNHLTSDVRNLQSQIESIRNTPAAVLRDTVYIVDKSNAYKSDPSQNQVASAGEAPTATLQQTSENSVLTGIPKENRTVKANTQRASGNMVRDNFKSTERSVAQESNLAEPANVYTNETDQNQATDFTNIQPAMLSPRNRVEQLSGKPLLRKMKYSLASRISPREVSKNLLVADASRIPAPSAVASGKKADKAIEAATVVPRLDIKVPYRFGAGYQVESNGQARSIMGEVLVSRKFSIAAGISWLKVKPLEFFTEKMFREKNHKDFKRTHPEEVPLAFDVFNIKVDPTIVQIPLTVAFRNTMKHDWAYYASAGANFTVSAKENISFDCKTPNNEYFNQAFERKADAPLVNSMNFSVGLEKSFHPIVVQAEGYLYTYFKPLTPFSHSAGPGVKVKLLYQIGGKM